VRRCACTALVLLAPVAIVGSGAAAQVSGIIVFSSNRDGDYDIYAVNPDGTGLTRLLRPMLR